MSSNKQMLMAALIPAMVVFILFALLVLTAPEMREFEVVIDALR